MNLAARPDVLIVTRGFLHPLPAGLLPADRVFDLRDSITDPARRPEGDMLDMTGLDPEVRAFVLATRGAEEFLEQALSQICDNVSQRSDTAAEQPTVVHVGCAGGKHRAPAIGVGLATRLIARGLRVAVRHLHVHLPRVVRPTELAA